MRFSITKGIQTNLRDIFLYPYKGKQSFRNVLFLVRSSSIFVCTKIFCNFSHVYSGLIYYNVLNGFIESFELETINNVCYDKKQMRHKIDCKLLIAAIEDYIATFSFIET